MQSGSRPHDLALELNPLVFRRRKEGLPFKPVGHGQTAHGKTHPRFGRIVFESLPIVLFKTHAHGCGQPHADSPFGGACTQRLRLGAVCRHLLRRTLHGTHGGAHKLPISHSRDRVRIVTGRCRQGKNRKSEACHQTQGGLTQRPAAFCFRVFHVFFFVELTSNGRLCPQGMPVMRFLEAQQSRMRQSKIAPSSPETGKVLPAPQFIVGAPKGRQHFEPEAVTVG